MSRSLGGLGYRHLAEDLVQLPEPCSPGLGLQISPRGGTGNVMQEIDMIGLRHALPDRQGEPPSPSQYQFAEKV